MKVLRVLFVGALLLTLFTGAAHAAAPDRAVGFVQVLSDVDASGPTFVQIERAFGAVMPQVLAAQQRGQILDFETSWSTGVLKLVYRPSMGVLYLGGRKVYADMGLAIAAGNLPPRDGPDWAQGDVAGAANPGWFYMGLYDNYFSASGLPAGLRVIGSLRNAAGVLMSVSDGTVDGSGNLSSYFSWNGPYASVLPGYKITFKAYSGTTLTFTYTVTAPNFKFTSIDKAHSIVKGTGPAGKSFAVSWTHSLWDAAKGTQTGYKTSTVSGAGTWSVDFGANPIHGGDYLTAFVQHSSNFVFERNHSVAHIYCTLGSNSCSIYGFPFTSAALHIVHGGLTHDYSGSFDRYGSFWVNLQFAGGVPMLLAPGDKASGTGVAQYSLPNLTASIAYSTDVVSGKAPANRYFDVYVFTQSSQYYIYSHSNAMGSYATDFTSKINLISGDPYAVQVSFQLPSTGNITSYRKAFGP